MSSKQSRTSGILLILYAVAGAIYFARLIYVADGIQWTTTNFVLLAVLPAVGQAVVLIGLFLRHDIKTMIAITAVTLTAAIYAAELYLTMGLHMGLPIVFDRSTKAEKVLELRKTDANVYPSFHFGPVHYPGFVVGGRIVAPFGGIANATTVYCNESGVYAVYHSDKYGFRNPKGIWASGQVDIAMLGDSFTHGACVPPGQDVAAFLREKYPNTLNVGYGGFGPLRQLGNLREYLALIKPKVVFWVQTEGSIVRVDFEKTNAVHRRYLEESGYRQGLIELQPELDRYLRNYIDSRIENVVRERQYFDTVHFIKLIKFQIAIGSLFSQPVPPERPPTGERLLLLRSILERAAETVHTWGGKLVFVLLPSFERVHYPALHDVSANNWRDKCQNGHVPVYLCNQAAMDEYIYRDKMLEMSDAIVDATVDLLPALAAHPDTEALVPLRRPNHYNGEGYKIIADVLAEEARKHIGH